MASENLLQINKLSKRFGETQALRDVSIDFQPGTFHTIFGENGSGKSTLVKIVAGIIVPDSGSLRLGEHEISRFHPRNMKSLGIVSVMQEVLVAPNRTVLENIFMGYDGLFRRRLPLSQRASVARDILSQITTTPFDLKALVEDIPLPQQQLVVIARALVNEPRILILDEATASLDMGDRRTLFEALRRFLDDGITIIYISHRMDEVLELSDEVTVLRSGKKVQTLQRADVSAERLLQLVQPEATEIMEKIHDG